MAKQKYYQFIGGFIDGVVSKPATGFTKSRAVALERKVKGTRLKTIFLNAKKRDWVDRLFGRRTTKREKLIVKGTVYTAGALALLGAGSKIASRYK
jgi:hypothetical protein